MKKLLCLLLSALLPALALGEHEISWLTGERYFPDERKATYCFAYQYPRLTGDTIFAAQVNDYYEVALSEMLELVLPMFANEKDMTDGGLVRISHMGEVMCDTDDFFSVRMVNTQTIGDKKQTTLSSQVFAVSGEYEGETLTLRGLVMVGESSAQLAELVLADIVKTLLGMEGLAEGWTPETLALDFFPEQDFYADSDANAVFYIQPGVLREDALLFTYTRDELRALLPISESQPE